MFTARGYNIDSLTVADISEDHAISRITIVTAARAGDRPDPRAARTAVPVHKVIDLTESSEHVERELKC